MWPCAASGKPLVMSVSMYPGAMQLARMPRPAYSFATDLVKPISPALLAA